MRCLQRQLSDVAFRALQADLLQHLEMAGPEGRSGTTLTSSAIDLSPMASSSEKSLTGPASQEATPDRKKAKVLA